MAGKSLKKPSKEARQDAVLATNMVLGSIYHGDGINKLMSLVKSAGPKNAPMAVAHGLYASIATARHQLEKNQMPVDSTVWTSKGGVVDRVVNDAAGLVASNFGAQFNSPQFKTATKNALLQAMHQQEIGRGGKGMPQPEMDDETTEDPAAPDEPEQQGLVAPPEETM